MTPFIATTKAIGLSECGGRKPQSLLTAARHNLREIQLENGAAYGKINHERTALNVVLIGPSKAKEVEEASLKLFRAANVDPLKIRRDHNQAHETVISVEREMGAEILFQTIADNANYIFGIDVVLSLVVHNDQNQPHCHVLTAPIEGGSYLGSKRMKGRALDLMKRRLNEVTNPIGFTLKARTTRQDLSDKASAVISTLEQINHPILKDPLFPSIMQMIQKNPSPLFDLFETNKLLQRPANSDERLRKDRRSLSKPRLYRNECVQAKSLSCVGLIKEESSEVQSIEAITVRETDLNPAFYDQTTGEFIQPIISPRLRDQQNF